MSLGLTPFSFMRDECVRLMTRNSTHSNPTVFSRGRMYRFNMFSLPIGVVSFSDGNSQPSPPVSGEDESHSFRSCCSPDGSAARCLILPVRDSAVRRFHFRQ